MRTKDLQQKKAVTAVLVVLLASAVGMTNAMAQTFTSGNLRYTVTGDNTVKVIGHVNGTNATGSLTIPYNVLYDGHYYTVTAIGNNAFYNCSGLTGDLVIPDAVNEIGNNAFYYCSGFTGNLTIGSSVSSIGSYAFSDCTGFAGTLTLTHELSSVGTCAFNNCPSLTGSPSIVLTGTIGNEAFDGCSSLAGEFTIGEAVTSIGEGAFRDCSSMTAVHFNAVSCADMYGALSRPFINCTGVLEIGPNVERIPNYMFRQAAFTGSLVIPDAVTEIGEHAFYNCSGFNGSLTIGDGVTTIGNYAFYYCSGFTDDLTIGASVSSIGQSAFSNCTGFAGTLTLTHTLSLVGATAFCNCSSLTGSPSIVLTGTIGNEAFDGCSNLAGEFTIGEAVTSIGEGAFRDCSSMTAVHFNAVSCADLYSALSRPFINCTGVLEIGPNVERIPNYMFRQAAFTGSLVIPDAVTEIGEHAFYNCSGFNGSLTIGDGVTTIGNYAFYYCSGFTDDLTIGASVSSIGQSAFSNCTGFAGTLTLTHTLSLVGATAFCNCSSLTGSPSIVLTGTIGRYAFDGCSSLAGEFIISETVSSIGEKAFRNCSSITAVHFNQVNISSMNSSSIPFDGCTAVLVIESSVGHIPDYMFRYASFTAIHSHAEIPPTMGTGAFQFVNHDIPFIVPCGSLEDYQNADGWSTFTNIIDDCPEPHEIAATANPTIGGTITGAGTYYLGDMATLTATPNEGFTFVNWTKDSTVVSTNPTYSFMVMEDASFVANFEMIIVTQTTTLVSGWNWWSTYAGQNYIDGLSLLEESLGGNGSVIKSQNAFVEYSSTSGWAGTLQSINNESSYKILVAEDCTSEINGSQLLPENHPITLDPGWTWIGYLMEQPQTITTALGNYEPSVNDILKGQGGYAIYLPNIGWLPANFTLNPGIGYQYYSMQPESQTLMYANSRENAPAVEPDNRYWQNDIHAYADNLCLMAVVTINGTEQRSEDLELGAFVNGECRGSAKLLYIEPLDRYYAMMTITGQNDEVVEFALFDEIRHLGSALSTTHLTFSSNVIVGTYDAPFDVAFSAMTAIEEHTATLHLYPNPVNRNETFNIVIPEDETVVEMTVMNETGAVVLCEKGIDTRHSVSGLSASGLYMIRVVSKSGKVYQSRLVVR